MRGSVEKQDNKKSNSGKKVVGFKLSYTIINICLSSSIGAVIYRQYFIFYPPGIGKLTAIWISNVIFGLMSGWIAFAIYKKYGKYSYADLNSQDIPFYFREVLISGIQSVLTYYLFIEFLFDKTETLQEVFLWYAVAKWVIYATAYVIVDKMMGR